MTATAISRRAREPRVFGTGLARVLLVDDNPTSRLTLKTVLEASGYTVDMAASAAEAVEMLDQAEYALVLSDLQMESPEAGLKVLSHARFASYQPATALFTSQQDASPRRSKQQKSMLIMPEGIPGLLSKVASLISERATRRLRRELRLAEAH